MYNNNVSAIQDNSFNTILSKTFFWMFMGLLLTFGISFGMYTSNLALTLIPSFPVIGIVNLVVAIGFSFLSHKLSPQTCGLLFLIYSALNGITLSIIYYIYALDSIMMILVAAAGLFGAFGFLGYNSKIDLTNLGTLCIGVLIVGLLASFVNFFLQNSLFDIILSWVLLIAFFGITAYDLQKIKELAVNNPDDNKIHITAAFTLYLDFINIFLRLLHLFGKARD